MCTCHNFVESSICGTNSQHSMLDYHKENTVLWKNKFQWILGIDMLSYLVNIYSFGDWCI